MLLQPPKQMYIGPTFINFGFFPGPTALLEKYIKVIQMVFYSIRYVYLLFKALRLFFLPNFPGPTFIPCTTSIPEARVCISFFIAQFEIQFVTLQNVTIVHQRIQYSLNSLNKGKLGIPFYALFLSFLNYFPGLARCIIISFSFNNTTRSNKLYFLGRSWNF